MTGGGPVCDIPAERTTTRPRARTAGRTRGLLMTHFLLGAGLGAGSAGVALLASGSLVWAGVVGGLVLVVVWVGQNIADRHQPGRSPRDGH